METKDKENTILRGQLDSLPLMWSGRFHAFVTNSNPLSTLLMTPALPLQVPSQMHILVSILISIFE